MSKRQKQIGSQSDFKNNCPHACRVCLKMCKPKSMSLFEPYKDAAIFEHINSVANLNIVERDGFPDKICPECLIQLDICISFKKKCEVSNSYLLGNGYSYRIPIIFYQVKKEEPEYDSNEIDDCTFTEYSFDAERLNRSQPKLEAPNVCKELKKNEIRTPEPNKGPFQCHDCNQILKSKCKIGVHWKKKHLPQSMTCHICKRIFKSVNAYKRHQLEINKKICANLDEVTILGEGKNRVFQCTNCHYSNRNYSAIKVHLRRHNGLKPYQCKLCPNAFSQVGTLSSHMESCHNKIQVEITCQYCGKVIKGRCKAYKHLKLHSEERFQCDICKIFTKTKQSLRAHMFSHSGVKSFSCKICGASFYRMGELCNHKRNVHLKAQLPWYDCEICGYRSCKKAQFYRHKSKHSDNNCACAKCGKFFENEWRLQKHLRVHTEEKKYYCTLCNKPFSNNHSLRDHMRSKHESKYLKADKNAERNKQKDTAVSE